MYRHVLVYVYVVRTWWTEIVDQCYWAEQHVTYETKIFYVGRTRWNINHNNNCNNNNRIATFKNH